MCAWTITAVQPLDENAVVSFGPDFETHMMRGETKAGSHRGLHSLNLLVVNRDYHIDEGDKVDDNTCPQIFSAKVSLLGNQDEVERYGKQRTWLEKKLSTFFPTSMTYAEIQKCVTLAYQNYKGGKAGMIRKMPKHQSVGGQEPKVDFEQSKKDAMNSFNKQLGRLNVTDLGTKWAGQVKIANGGESWVIWIGSPQTGTENNKLLGAGPAVRGKFF